MSDTVTKYRLDGIYQQRQPGYFMQRVKLPAGLVSAQQAMLIAETARKYGKGEIHLTTRGSMEIHWLTEENLPAVKRDFAAVGLTSRGACGGAVRGVSCSTQGAAGFTAVESLARRIQRHFTANPRFESVPKKFKISVEATAASRRHLIQDVGAVLSGTNESGATYDFYIAGGLGKEPQAGLLFEKSLPETKIIPLIEAVIAVYCQLGTVGKHLKHLLNQLGLEQFRKLVYQQPTSLEELPIQSGLPEHFTHTVQSGAQRLVKRVFAGIILSEKLIEAAKLATEISDSYLMVTSDQNLAVHIPSDAGAELLAKAEVADFSAISSTEATFSVCPGADLCRMGLASTRDIAARISALPIFACSGGSYAISGCRNSCTQPQLADVGVVVSSLAKVENGEREPLFDIYGDRGEALGTAIHTGLTEQQLIDILSQK